MDYTIGVSYQQLQKYESGNNRVSASSLYKIAHILKQPIADFYNFPISEEELPIDVFFFSSKELDFLHAFQKVPKDIQRHIITLCESPAK